MNFLVEGAGNVNETKKVVELNVDTLCFEEKVPVKIDWENNLFNEDKVINGCNTIVPVKIVVNVKNLEEINIRAVINVVQNNRIVD